MYYKTTETNYKKILETLIIIATIITKNNGNDNNNSKTNNSKITIMIKAMNTNFVSIEYNHLTGGHSFLSINHSICVERVLSRRGIHCGLVDTGPASFSAKTVMRNPSPFVLDSPVCSIDSSPCKVNLPSKLFSYKEKLNYMAKKIE